jgi:excisionase family DNA binding protein
MPSQSARPSPWLTAEEAARQLATTAHNLRRLARLGRSPILARRVGSRWLFSRADLSRFIGPDAEHRAASEPRPEQTNLHTTRRPATKALETLVLPGFEPLTPDPTIQGRTCITDAGSDRGPRRS